MIQNLKVFAVMPVLLLAVATIGQIKSVKACGLDDIGSCFSAIPSALGSTPYAQGGADALYDHQQGLQYNPTPLCCHSELYDENFHQGYDDKWNSLQESTQGASVNVINSPGTTVNVGQTSNQNQGPSETPVVGCQDQCGGGPCLDSCGQEGPSAWFHHFGCGFNCGYGYRHIGFVDP